MHDRKAGQLVVEYLPSLTKKRQVAHCDIMHIGMQNFVVTLINPLNAAVIVNMTQQTRGDEVITVVKGILSDCEQAA